MFEIEFMDVNIKAASERRFTIGVFDMIRRELVFRKELQASNSSNVVFKTHQKTDMLEVVIYAGVAGKTKNISVCIEKIFLKIGK